MKVLKLISSVAIGVLILLVSILSFLGKVEESTVKVLMLIGTIVWFATTPFWMKEDK